MVFRKQDVVIFLAVICHRSQELAELCSGADNRPRKGSLEPSSKPRSSSPLFCPAICPRVQSLGVCSGKTRGILSSWEPMCLRLREQPQLLGSTVHLALGLRGAFPQLRPAREGKVLLSSSILTQALATSSALPSLRAGFGRLAVFPCAPHLITARS